MAWLLVLCASVPAALLVVAFLGAIPDAPRHRSRWYARVEHGYRRGTADHRRPSC